MRWREVFLEVACKSLYSSELPQGRSNQHELNVPLNVLPTLLKYDAQRWTADVTVFPPAPQTATSLRFVDVVFYNARQFHPERTAEFRLYYSRTIDSMLASIQKGDKVFFCIDIDERFRLVFVSRASPYISFLEGLTDFGTGSLWEENVDLELQEQLSLNAFYRVENAGDYHRAYDESLGSKTKGWFYHADNPDFEVLRKVSRPNTIEGQIEKLSAELARLVGIPHATISLLTSDEALLEVLCPSFGRPRPLGTAEVRRKRAKRAESRTIEVVLGNRVLQSIIPAYDLTRKRSHSSHTLENIMSAVESMAPGGSMGMLKYLLFDCWIGNTDRHHENWAILRIVDRNVGQYCVLAPTYDHGAACASSLRTDDRIRRGEDMNSFYRNGHSAVFDSAGKALTFYELADACFRYEIRQTGLATTCAAFIEHIGAVSTAEISACLARFPPTILGDEDAQFILKYLTHTASVLARIAEAFPHLEGGPPAR